MPGSQSIKETGESHQRSHALQGQAADTQSPSPMLEAHWETVHHNTSILFFKQAVVSLQVQPLLLSLANSCKMVHTNARMNLLWKIFFHPGYGLQIVAFKGLHGLQIDNGVRIQWCCVGGEAYMCDCRRLIWRWRRCLQTSW